jgi:hypothetical protein
MSYLSVLFASKAHGMTLGSRAGAEEEREAFAPEAAETARSSPSTSLTAEQALPLGITSLQHWLDLNA